MSKIPMFPNKFAILASILGVLVNRRTPASGETDMDANNCLSTGFYYIKTSGSIPYADIHLPSGSNIIIIVFNLGGTGYYLQMGVEQTGKLFYREFTDRTSWTTWKEV